MSEAEFLKDYELARRTHGALWAAGDYTRVAEQLTGVSAAVVGAAGVGLVCGCWTIMALQLAAKQGRRAELSAGLLELYSGANTATDGTLAFEQEYLLATAAARAGG